MFDLKKITLFTSLLMASCLITSCQTLRKSDYEQFIVNAAKSQKHYSGFHQTFEASVLPMNREVTNRMLEKKAELLEWSAAELETEMRKADDERLTHSHFFLRFFSPEVHYNDFHQPDTIWKVYLVIGNQKYEPKIKKDFSKLVELQTLYPFFDRFSSGYDLAFPIGQAALNGTEYKIILTSSLGRAEFSF